MAAKINIARHDVEYLNEKLGLQLPEEDAYETLGGLILHTLASIPKKGDEIKINGILVSVNEMRSHGEDAFPNELVVPRNSLIKEYTLQ